MLNPLEKLLLKEEDNWDLTNELFLVVVPNADVSAMLELLCPVKNDES